MNEVIRAATQLQAVCETNRWRSCLIGGLALQRWGEPRVPHVAEFALAHRVLLKAFAARPKDWLDVEGIMIRQTGRLDWTYIRRQLRPLVELKEAPGIMDELERRRGDCER